MNTKHITTVASAIMTLFVSTAFAAEAPPTFTKDVLPILEKRCTACHGEDKIKGKLRLDTAASLLTGGKNGTPVVPGKPDDSLLVKRIEARDDFDIMPPEKEGPPLTLEQIAVIRAWIQAGAVNDQPDKPTATAPPKPPTAEDFAAITDAPEISALAFDPTSKLLARGGYQTVDLLDAATGKTVATLAPHAEAVVAIAFSPDGKTLAAAGGIPGQTGQVKIWDVATRKPIRTIDAHDDTLYAVAFSPDGKILATTSYDQTAKLWDAASGELLKSLRDHVDAVFDAAFSPDGEWLATAAADRTVKIWQVATGNRLYTLSDALKSLNTVTFHPGGKQIAAAGADKMIRVWNLTEKTGTLAQSAFAHDGAVLHMAYSPDGQTLYSTADDRTLKAWNTDALTESKVFGPQSDWVQALALSPDGHRLAAGRYDGSLTVYDADTAKPVFDIIPETTKTAAAQRTPSDKKSGDNTGKLVVENDDPLLVDVVLGAATVPGSLSSISKRGATRGQTLTVTLNGKNLEAAEFAPLGNGLTAKITENKAGRPPKLTRNLLSTAAQVIDTATPYTITAEFTLADDASPGLRNIKMITKTGATNTLKFVIEDRPEIPENKENNTLADAQEIPTDALVIGRMDRAGDEDHYAFKAKPGQELVAHVVASALGSGLTSKLTLMNAAGRVLADSDDFGTQTDARLGYRFTDAGTYVLRLTDRLFQSGQFYRLHLGEFGMVTAVQPAGLKAGDSRQFILRGFNLNHDYLTVTAPQAADWSTTIPVPVKSKGPLLFNRRIAVGPYDDLADTEPNDDPARAQSVNVPIHVNGLMDDDGLGNPDVDHFRFTAKKGQRLILDVQAQQIDSDMDSTIEILDPEGQPIERATVRCVAQTRFVLSGRDARQAGWRLQSWADLAIDDHLMAGNEIARVRALPDFSDEDVMLVSSRGVRRTYLGTTPEFHEVGSKAYKVEIHPPGMTFPPNGMPVYHVFYRNDDGGNPFHKKDSRLVFDPPADGDYIVKITDTSGRTGSQLAYRLNVRPPEPDYRLLFSKYDINVPAGGRVDVNAVVNRFDDFAGPIHVKFDELPQGLSITEATILENQEEVTLTLTADENAASTPAGNTFNALAVADVNGKPVTRQARIGQILVTSPADIDITLAPKTVQLVPGGPEVEVAIHVDRRHGFTDRVRMDVRNLPHGVAVQNTGLNGVLVRKNENGRTFKLRAESWVPKTDRPILAVGTVETRSPVPTIYASHQILLKIAPENQLTKAPE